MHIKGVQMHPGCEETRFWILSCIMCELLSFFMIKINPKFWSKNFKTGFFLNFCLCVVYTKYGWIWCVGAYFYNISSMLKELIYFRCLRKTDFEFSRIKWLKIVPVLWLKEGDWWVLKIFEKNFFSIFFLCAPLMVYG